MECMEYTIVTNNQKLKHETTTQPFFFIAGGINLSGGRSTHFFTVLAINT